MKLIVDRIEGSLAVCEKEDGSFVDIEMKHLPNEIKVGDVIMESGEKYEIDRGGTKNRREKVEEMMKDMWE